MRIVFLYVRHRNGEHFAERVREEGYYYLLRALVREGVVDDVLVVIEGRRAKRFDYEEGIRGEIVTDMDRADRILRPGDVIWVRGGWKTWFHFLERAGEKGLWRMIYAANTGREKWRFWDVIWDDLAGRDFVDGVGRVHLDFRKPIHPEYFYPVRPSENGRKYAFCIGASHIHDKKGQWRMIEVLKAWRKIFGREPECVMPGSIHKGVKTGRIREEIKRHGLRLELPGMVDRHVLRRIFNQSEVFVHLGAHGQGDRGVMEAMRCGCRVAVGYPQYHAPWTWEVKRISRVVTDPDDPFRTARELKAFLEDPKAAGRAEIFGYAEAQAGVYSAGIPMMLEALEYMRFRPAADRAGLARDLGVSEEGR